MRALPTRAALAILLLLLPGAASPAGASPFDRDENPADGLVTIGFGYLSGSTLYHISSYDAAGSGVESELEFPLRTALFGLELGYAGKDRTGRDGFSFGLLWLTELGNGSGQVQDSDWLTSDRDTNYPTTGAGYPHPGVDIYSLSDMRLEATIFDLRAAYSFWPSDHWSIGPLAGWLYERFSFDVHDVQQWGYGPYATDFTGSASGPVATYEVTYTVPYWGIRTSLDHGTRLRMTVDLAYSFQASAEDEDDHILRSKLSRATATGTALLASVTGQWSWTDRDALQLRCQYLDIRTTGTQTQTFYDGSGIVFSGIDDKITSEQLSTLLFFAHRF